MSSVEEREDHDIYCEKAVALIIDLCVDNSPLLQPNTCQDFITLLATNQSSNSSGSALCTTFIAVAASQSSEALGMQGFLNEVRVGLP
ncbi:hypothetical protein DPEC_G00195500 [Dallia pectoralis]|uniref:Uncharacterized protein n=1 Tax=Dallia pectoralis TaxID=75939 RepID=A0ACC2G7N6_DALPE|nr:hypothetical protein DPEC_G00195500 [Dallia pectoralis]